MTCNRSFVRGMVAFLALGAFPVALLGQGRVPWSPLKRGSDNIEVVGHLPLGPSVADVDIEQELDRPYAYVGRILYNGAGPKGLFRWLPGGKKQVLHSPDDVYHGGALIRNPA